MPLWEILLDVDTVLRSQGVDPFVIRERNPRLVDITHRAISEGMSMVHPVVHQHQLKAVEFSHAGLLLEGGHVLTGPLISRHLAGASEVIAVLCTIGPALEARVSSVIASDPALGLALDAVGTAAIDLLSHAVCDQVDQQARDLNMQATIPLHPGMVGWPLSEGQTQLFSLWAGQSLEVQLSDSCMMIPSKSLSMVIGMGSEVLHEGKPCDYCSSSGICRYQDQHAR